MYDVIVCSHTYMVRCLYARVVLKKLKERFFLCFGNIMILSFCPLSRRLKYHEHVSKIK